MMDNDKEQLKEDDKAWETLTSLQALYTVKSSSILRTKERERESKKKNVCLDPRQLADVNSLFHIRKRHSGIWNKFYLLMINSYDNGNIYLQGDVFIIPKRDKLIYQVTKINELIHEVHKNKSKQTSQTLHVRQFKGITYKQRD